MEQTLKLDVDATDLRQTLRGLGPACNLVTTVDSAGLMDDGAPYVVTTRSNHGLEGVLWTARNVHALHVGPLPPTPDFRRANVADHPFAISATTAGLVSGAIVIPHAQAGLTHEDLQGEGAQPVYCYGYITYGRSFEGVHQAPLYGGFCYRLGPQRAPLRACGGPLYWWQSAIDDLPPELTDAVRLTGWDSHPELHVTV